MARPLWLVVAPLSVFLLVALTACGGSSSTQTTTAATASKSAAAAIRNRLTKAGYTVDDASTPGTAKVAKARGELDAFSVQADFTSPDSYHLGVTVFQSATDLARYLRQTAAAQKKDEASSTCKQSLGCEAFFKSIHGPHPPIVQRALGPILYTGIVDKPGATLPLHSFSSLVALASGRST